MPKHPLAGTFQLAWIVDCIPERNNYRIRVPGVPDTFEAVRAAEESLGPGSTQGMSAFEAGTAVLAFFLPIFPHYPALILKAVPLSTQLQNEGYDVRPGTTRHCVYPPYQEYKPGLSAAEVPYRHGVEEYSTPDQIGTMIPSGVQIWGNFFQAVLKASEKSGIEAHVIDSLLKIIGFNMTIMCGCAVDERISDGGEYSEMYFSTPYLWKAKEGALQPKRDLNESLPHHVRLRGYQGDVERELVQLDPSPMERGELLPFQGARVLEINKSFDGEYGIRSAKGIVLRKVSPAGPLLRLGPTENRAPGALAGIFPANQTAGSMGDYHPTGAGPGYGQFPTGSIDERKLITTIITSPEDIPGNYQGMIARQEDSYRYNEREKTIAYSSLLDWGDTPEFTLEEQNVLSGPDHRGSISFYPSAVESLIKVTEDGSLVLEVGESKLVMGKESMEIYSPALQVLATAAAIGASRIALTSWETLQLIGNQRLALYGGEPGGSLVHNFQKGYIQADRDETFDTVDIRVYANDGTGWSLVHTESGQDNDGSHSFAIPAAAVNKAVKLQVGQTNADGVWEYLECDLQGLGGGGTVSRMLIAKADMTEDDYEDLAGVRGYLCSYLDSDGTESGGIRCQRPNGIYISSGDIGFLGVDTDGDNVFIPANMREEYHMPLIVERRDTMPTDPEVGRIWIMEY